ncbi:MAG: hypothetical protein ACSW8K_05325 [bacterium]|nr:hypothetical protein [Lachnospiraceae bacterium]
MSYGTGSENRKGWSARDIAVTGTMVALLEISKRALDLLPNIELITFLFIMFTLYRGWKTLAAAMAFATFECVYFGFGPWTLTYYYVWPVLILLVMAARKKGRTGALYYALLSGAYGLFFGFLCSLYTLVLSGPKVQFAWWVAGIPYDITHCIGNFTICLVLFGPMNSLMLSLRARDLL